MEAEVDRRAVLATIAVNGHSAGLEVDGGDQWRGLLDLGPAGRVAGRREVPVEVRQKRHKVDKQRSSGKAVHAGSERLACMLRTPGPSSWVAGATESRSPVGAGRRIGPQGAPRAAVASKERTKPYVRKHCGPTNWIQHERHEIPNLR